MFYNIRKPFGKQVIEFNPNIIQNIANERKSEKNLMKTIGKENEILIFP